MKYKQNVLEEFMWSPVVEQNYWTINLINIRKITYKEDKKTEDIPSAFAKNHKKCPGGCHSIVDTGTYLIYGPSDVIIHLLKDVNISSCNDKSTLPDIAFEFQGEAGNFEIILHPEDYVLHFQSEGEDDCVIGIVPDNMDSGYTFG